MSVHNDVWRVVLRCSIYFSYLLCHMPSVSVTISSKPLYDLKNVIGDNSAFAVGLNAQKDTSTVFASKSCSDVFQQYEVVTNYIYIYTYISLYI